MLRSSLCDAYIIVDGNLIITAEGANDAAIWTSKINKGVIFSNFATFRDCISKINNTLIDHEKDLDVVKSMHNLIEYRENYSKNLGSL